MKVRLTGVIALLFLQLNAFSKCIDHCKKGIAEHYAETNLSSIDTPSMDKVFSFENVALCSSQIQMDSLDLPQDLRSTSEEKIIKKILIYPNPATNNQLSLKMKFSIRTNVRIDLMSMSGTLYKSLNQLDVIGHQVFMIDVSDLPEGMYYLNTYAGQESVTKKFVKK